jgi:hypothetical protein
MVEEVRRRLSGLFADARLQQRGLPAALIYWPITAGGLALVHPMLRVASYLPGRKPAAEPQLPSAELVAAYVRRRPPAIKERPLDQAETAFLLGLAESSLIGKFSRDDLVAEFRNQMAAGQTLPPTEAEQVMTAHLWSDCYNRLVAEIEPAAPPPLPSMEQLVNDFINRGTEVAGRAQEGLSPYWRWVVYTYGPSLLEALGTFRFLMTELVPLQLILETRGGLPSVEGRANSVALGWEEGRATPAANRHPRETPMVIRLPGPTASRQPDAKGPENIPF